mgnify:CR=1 FL=1
MTAAEQDNPRLQISPVATIPSGTGTFRQTLPPMSLTILSTYELKHAQPGITVE